MAKKNPPAPPDDASGTDAPPAPHPTKPRRRRTPVKRTDTQASATAAETSTSATVSAPSGLGDRHGEDPSRRASRPGTMGSEPSEEAIRMRAYQRYLERGGGHGMDFEDWLEAERELRKS
jgi:hypothetical protein